MNMDYSNDHAELQNEPTYTLEELLENCRPENRHEPIEFGIAGKELI